MVDNRPENLFPLSKGKFGELCQRSGYKEVPLHMQISLNALL